MVNWTETRVSKDGAVKQGCGVTKYAGVWLRLAKWLARLPAKNNLEPFIFCFSLVFPTDLSVAKEADKKTEELSCNSMVYCPSHGSTRQIFLILSSYMKTIQMNQLQEEIYIRCIPQMFKNSK